MHTTLLRGSSIFVRNCCSASASPGLQSSLQVIHYEHAIPFQRSRRCKGRQLARPATAALNFGDEGFATDQGSLLGPPPPSPKGPRPQGRGSAPVATNIEEVNLESEVHPSSLNAGPVFFLARQF